MPDTDQTLFTKALSRLNQAQRQAVEQTEGPLLVIAGPGTGKTQLLSARVAYILQQTDALPQNILCLTFTESGAQNMRDRLTSFIGQAAYDVTIGTYHAFGGELIGRFPQYFGEHRAQQAADNLAQRQIIQDIVEKLPHRHPLKSTRHHLHDLLATISEVKRGLLGEDELRAVAADNLRFLESANKELVEIFAGFTSMTAKLEVVLPFFENLHTYLGSLDGLGYKLATAGPLQIGSLAGIIEHSLESALAQAADEHSKKPLTAWKNQWLIKNADNKLAFDGVRQNQRIAGIADVLRDYTQALQDRGLYDFDDMILRSIKALQQHDDLRFTLQEQYQYIMLDEFQDTNAAQLELISQLTNNPVSEGRPNVMAVGDDDQAIYAFQGAEVSNMLAFAHAYRDTSVINLTDNYRSHPEILHVAHQVAGQINDRLSDSLPAMSKVLAAANADLAQPGSAAHIDRHEFQSDVAQYDWLAGQIAELIKGGVPAHEIAVLAPRHKQLEPLVAFLNQRDIPVRYEKRENILQAPVVQQLLTIAKLILALAGGQEKIADALWPEILSYNFWQLPTSAIWQLSWRVRNGGEDGTKTTWSQAILADQQFRAAGLLVLSLAQRANTESLEVMLDAIVGNEALTTHEPDMPTVHSPLRNFYMGDALAGGGQDVGQGGASADLFYQTMSHITCLREKLRDHQNSQEDVLKLADLLRLVQLYEDAGERMLNTSPYNQHAEAVQLMTVFKAKGLEFEHVFLPSVQDDVWGNASRAQSNRLTLPPNLLAIRPAGTTEDERLRIFFVAVTRAKIGLHLTSFTQTYSGRATKRLKYLNEQQSGDGFKTLILPAEVQDVKHIDHEVPQLSTLELNWRQRHLDELQGSGASNLRDLLQGKLERFQLSPTMVTGFTDLLYGGPQDFFFKHILQFPQAAGAEADYGTAIHETLQWYQQQLDSTGQAPSPQAAITYYDNHIARKHLLPEVSQQLKERGDYMLQHYLTARGDRFKAGNKAEHNFRNENVWVGPAHMSGKIDLMEIDRDNKTIAIVDYKTGKAYDRWSSDAKLHKYRHQLMCYKLLVENSRSYKGYRVKSARLEFVEPDEHNKLYSLELHFDDPKVKQELEHTSQLIQAIWQHAMALDFPDINSYDPSLTGIKQFETDLLA